MVRKSMLGVLATMLSATANAQTPIYWGPSCQFMEDNDLYLQDCRDCEGGLSQEEFRAILAKANDVFGPLVRAQGGSLTIKDLWDDSTVNASATQLFGTWTVNMYGGMARRPEMTADSFTLVLCHEMGHHLGGFPFGSFWGANEGQADYFATHVCPALWWANDTEVNAAASSQVPESVKERCSSAWKTASAQDLCNRTALASKGLGDVLAALKHSHVSFDDHDANEVSATDNSHPAAQCRLDTYVAGAACVANWDTSVIPGKENGFNHNSQASEEESAHFTCTASGQYALGLRPRCWFKPRL